MAAPLVSSALLSVMKTTMRGLWTTCLRAHARNLLEFTHFMYSPALFAFMAVGGTLSTAATSAFSLLHARWNNRTDIMYPLGHEEFLATDQVLQTVDALVNDLIDDSVLSSSVHLLEQPRRATPTVPPGLSIPPSVVPKAGETVPAHNGGIGQSSITTPATPILQPTSSITPIPNKKDRIPIRASKSEQIVNASHPESPSSFNQPQPEVVAPPSEPVTAALPKSAVADVGMSVKTVESVPKEMTTKTGKQDAESPQATIEQSNSIATQSQDELTTNEPPASPDNVEGDVSAGANPDEATSPHIEESKSSLKSGKRQHPGKLDITAAVAASTPSKEPQSGSITTTSAKPDTPAKILAAAPTSLATSRPATPAGTSTGSPMKRPTQPRTIRVLATPKAETPPPLSSSSIVPPPPSAAAAKLPSRQPSVTSINRPGTPASERISDIASIASTSLSRANSPPPSGKVGTAPVKKGKNQAKKDRQERAKQIAEEKTAKEEVDKEPAEEVVYAPIVARKKKTRKLTANATATSTPVPSRPASPGASTKQAKSEAIADNAPATAITKDAAAEPAKSLPAQQQEPTSQTAASIIKSLLDTGEITQSALDIFKPVTGLNHRHEFTREDLQNQALGDNYELTPSQLAKLNAHEPLRFNTSDNSRVSGRNLITAAGTRLRCLSKEQEDRYLELEARVLAIKGPGRWNPSNKSAVVGTMLDGIVAGVVSVADQQNKRAQVGQQKQAYADEAWNYVNEFIFPGLVPQQPQQQLNAQQQQQRADAARYGFAQGSEAQVNSVGASMGVPAAGGNAHAGVQGATGRVTAGLPLLGIEEAEAAMLVSRKEAELLEKKLNGIIKRNRKAVLSATH